MEEEKWREIADLVQETYLYADGKNPEPIGDFQPIKDQFTDVAGAWKNDKKKEIVLTHRGIMLSKPKDVKTLLTEIIPAYLPRGDPEEYENTYPRGGEMIEDLEDFKSQIYQLEQTYPGYEIILGGHSRGGGVVLEAGRDGNYTTHAFAPISKHNEENQLSRRPTTHMPSKINIYYTDVDTAPKYLRELKDRTKENHILIEPRDDILSQEGALMKVIGMSGHNTLHFTTDIDFEDLTEEEQADLELFNETTDPTDFYRDYLPPIPTEVRDTVFQNREPIRDYLEPQPKVIQFKFSDLVELFPMVSRFRLRSLFDKYDYDGSGYLDEQELERLIADLE
jgi:hypothetical protein